MTKGAIVPVCEMLDILLILVCKASKLLAMLAELSLMIKRVESKDVASVFRLAVDITLVVKV